MNCNFSLSLLELLALNWHLMSGAALQGLNCERDLVLA